MRYFLLIAFMAISFFGLAQDPIDTIFLKNPSFEQGHTFIGVDGWTDTGPSDESPYDAQPGLFGCNQRPAHGNGYVGMVVRDVESYESMSQRLYKPLQKGKCYAFSLKLARSKYYTSPSKKTGDIVPYTTPARIRIWGGNTSREKREMLAETRVIVNTAWKAFFFDMKPIRDYQYISIEAFYKTPTLFPYNGNVLIDDASNIYEMDCADSAEELIASLDSATPPKEVPKRNPKPKPRPSENVVIKPPTQPKAKIKTHMPELNKKLKKGETLAIPDLAFEANSYDIPAGCQAVLGELYDYLKENASIKIELGGHTNNRCDDEYCNKLSELRAKAIADELIKKGINPNRITYKGYGKVNPRATNTTKIGRLYNQRVEVKIL